MKKSLPQGPFTADTFPQVSMDAVRQYVVSGEKVNWQANLKLLTKDDVFINSYPRSGNTWLRLMLVDIFWQLSGNDTRDKKLVMLYFSPTLEKLNFKKIVRPDIGFFLIKTHSSTVAEGHRFIYLFRDPVDSLVSHYRLLQRRAVEPMEPGLLEFCKVEVEAWKKSVSVAYGNRANGLFISFEDMLAHPHQACRKACDFIGLPASDAQIALAVENQSMDKLVAILKSRGQENEKSFRLAHGKSGAGSQYLDASFETHIQTACQAEYERIQRRRCRLT